MSKFAIGDKVVRVDNDSHGVIVNVKIGRGKNIYNVIFEDGESTVLESDLRKDFDITDPFERCKSGIFSSFSDYAKKNTTFKIANSNNSTISSLKASKTLFKAYQFKPLLKFLNSPNRRLLVADEVGLGKTIEAGHIMLELKARNELKNVLIVCPKSLQEKWRSELYEKFGLAFKIIENSKDLISDLESRAGVVRAIVNYEKIRLSKGGENKTQLIAYLASHRFSLVVCDEAHKMRNSGTQTYRGAELLMETADAAIFLTATPVMISEENLYNLLHLLDNASYYNYEIFQNLMDQNRPFVEAISMLNHKVPYSEIREKLLKTEVNTRYSVEDRIIYSDSLKISEIYKDNPRFQEIDDLLQGTETDAAGARLQFLFATMSVMNLVFSRTRKREVTTDMSQAERKPHIRKIVLNAEEQTEYDKIIEAYEDDNSYTDIWGEERLTPGGTLGLVQRKRQIASSVWGFLNNEASLDKGIDEYASFADSKVDELINVIQEVLRHGSNKIVVFALFRKTLKYLSIRLKNHGYKSVIIHGLVDNRADVLQQFRDDDSIQILLSSEVGSEGLDMQFCNSMINYDLPWNPMVVEQRIGRIDRFGQKSPVVNIYNFVVADSIQEVIYEKLLKRIGIFQSSIGDLEAILDAQVFIDGKTMTIQDAYNKMEKEFYTVSLTTEEMEQKVKEIERAIANEGEHLKHIQEGLNNTLTNDAYFEAEISRLINKRAYVTKEELANYLKSVIRQHLTVCDLVSLKNDIWVLKIPSGQPSIVKNFLYQYCSKDDESIINRNHFIRKIEDLLEINLTFNQDVAYKNSSVVFVNIYHPLVQACLNYFLATADRRNSSFCYALRSDELLCAGNRYYMGLYQLDSERLVQGVKKNRSELLPIVFDLNKGVIEDSQMVVERLYSRSQIEGIEKNASNEDINPEMIDNMNFDFAECINKEIYSRIDDEKKQIESDRQRNEDQINIYYRSRINNHEVNIETWQHSINNYYIDEKERRGLEGAIRLAKARIAQLETERNERLFQINSVQQPMISNKLVSINLITII